MTDAEVLEDYLTSGYITKREAEFLYYYFIKCDRVGFEAARALGLADPTASSILNRLHNRGILGREADLFTKRGKYVLNHDYNGRVRQIPPPVTKVRPMTDAERDWMLANYKEKYSRNRGEAARLLGVDRYTVNEWAIQLKLAGSNSSGPRSATGGKRKKKKS